MKPMKLKQVEIMDRAGIALAKISVKHQQNKNKGMYDDPGRSPAQVLKGKRSYNFKKEFNRYVDEHYGDVLSKKDKKKLQGLVEEHYEEGCIENVEDLHRHIKAIGKKNEILFD
jgi:hypothetical protein